MSKFPLLNTLCVASKYFVTSRPHSLAQLTEISNRQVRFHFQELQDPNLAPGPWAARRSRIDAMGEATNKLSLGGKLYMGLAFRAGKNDLQMSERLNLTKLAFKLGFARVNSSKYLQYN